MKVYLYSRVSTSEQQLDQQERTAIEWLSSRGLKVDKIVSDEGVSGKVPYKDRGLGRIIIPQLQRGDLLIVSEISRLGRSMADLSVLVNTDLKERGIRLVVVSMGIDLDCDKMTALDQLILSNFAFAGQLERELTSSRTRSALDVRRRLRDENGGWVSKAGNWTTGFGKPAGKPGKPMSDVLKNAFKARISSDNNRRRQWLSIQEMLARGCSYESIAGTLNAIQDLPVKGGKWSRGQVYRAANEWGKYFEKD